MTTPVKPKVAKRSRKPRTRRVKEKKTAKIDVRVEPSFHEGFTADCKTKGHVPAKVLRRLVVAYRDAVQGKADLDGEWELRAKPPQK